MIKISNDKKKDFDWLKKIITTKKEDIAISPIIKKPKRPTIKVPKLSPLIQENIKILKDLTQYLKSMDNSLKTLIKEPIKVEIVK